MSAHGLDRLFDPESVALIGASADPGKWGQWLLPGLARNSSRRPLTLVNRRAEAIHGLPSVASLHDAAQPPDLVVVCVPPAHVPQAMTEAADVGARSAIVITSGIDTILGDGEEARLVAEAVRRGMRVVGPNCFGMYDADSDLHVTWNRVTPGALAIVSQSGSVGIECLNAASACGLGVSRFLSLGNQRDVTAAEVLADLVHHTPTRVVALYLESFSDGRAVIEAIQELRDAGKATVLLTVGASEASQKAARAHTSSSTSERRLVEAACRAAGTVLVSSAWELVDTARVLAGDVRPRGRRVAVVGDSGGQGAIAADLAHTQGLVLPTLGPATQARLTAALPYTAAVANPIDLGGAGGLSADNYVTIVEESARSGDVDSVILSGYFGALSGSGLGIDAELHAVHQMIDVSSDTGVTVVVHCQVEGGPALSEFHANRIATFPSIERAVRAAGTAAALTAETPRRLTHHAGPRVVAHDGPDSLRRNLEERGVHFGDPDESLRTSTDVEMLVAVRRDPSFGPVVIVGAGGLTGAIWGDDTLELAPLSHEVALGMIRRLRVATLLEGWRERPSLHVGALADLIVGLADLAMDHQDIEEIVLDPVLVTVDGVVVLDHRITIS